MKKINSELKLKDNNFKITIGTTDKKQPNTIYLAFGGYITPKEENNEYKKQIKSFDFKMKRCAEKIISNGILSDRNIIYISEIADERMKSNKKSYFDLQVYIPISKNILADTKNDFKNISKLIENEYIPKLSTNIISLMNDNGFTCHSLS